MWYSIAIIKRDFPGSALPDNAMTEQQKFTFPCFCNSSIPDAARQTALCPPSARREEG
jgi:hypothetical protein